MVIDLRTHVFSLVAVFLALGIGILVGVDLIGGRGIIAQEKGMVQRLELDFNRLRAENTQMAGQIKQNRAALAVNQEFGQGIVPTVISGRLQGTTVAVVVTDGADPTDTIHLLKEAGATLGPVISLVTSSQVSPSSQAAALALLKATKAGLYASLAQQMASGLANGASGNLDAIAQTGLFHITGSFDVPVQAILLVTGHPGQKDALAQSFGVPFVLSLKRQGVTVTQAEFSSVQAAQSTIPFFDGLGIATVDDLDQPSGEVSAVWGLTGSTGNWGEKPTAQSLMPPLVTLP